MLKALIFLAPYPQFPARYWRLVPGDGGEVAGRSARQGRVPHVDQERALVHDLGVPGHGGWQGRGGSGVLYRRLPAARGDGNAVWTRAGHCLKGIQFSQLKKVTEAASVSQF